MMHYAPKPRIAVQGSAKHRSRPEIPGGTSASGLIAAVQFLEAAGGRRPTPVTGIDVKRSFAANAEKQKAAARNA